MYNFPYFQVHKVLLCFDLSHKILVKCREVSLFQGKTRKCSRKWILIQGIVCNILQTPLQVKCFFSFFITLFCVSKSSPTVSQLNAANNVPFIWKNLFWHKSLAYFFIGKWIYNMINLKICHTINKLIS